MCLSAADEAAILAALSKVPDPEIPVISVTDLGIVRGIERDPPAVVITPTYSGCPATVAIESSVRGALDAAGFSAVQIRTALAPAWTTDWISDLGREQLREYGIAPPPRGAAAHSLQAEQKVACPRCNSTDTREISRFGSTPCKSQWQCRACLEPFDRFKCH
ncbi:MULTISPECIES: 1,2-phenylacetyl-CoA epoxidase subunit PaaD [unclassified Sphingobium]|uniref:1,2-phenylacetyl-CoA epoxidase subunit PaaD n=1 Tax=unclassified Sphingobium TaxID=2611147 RepID=UPI000D173702|nr:MULTISPECIES: 1,2-phenylacetyl-CoA epoxidase subunit PaaD [unclassified Sphingobium]PSO10024.1 phenylacetate-CoA oxygenase subunit PaaJ [Sphingobium sp. AEW4]